MTASELIEYLKKEDPKALVVVDGYEDGISEPEIPQAVIVELHVNDLCASGPHEIKEDEPLWDYIQRPGLFCKAVYLKRPGYY